MVNKGECKPSPTAEQGLQPPAKGCKKTYEETLMDVYDYSLEVGLPYRHVQIDSWYIKISFSVHPVGPLLTHTSADAGGDAGASHVCPTGGTSRALRVEPRLGVQQVGPFRLWQEVPHTVVCSAYTTRLVGSILRTTACGRVTQPTPSRTEDSLTLLWLEEPVYR